MDCGHDCDGRLNQTKYKPAEDGNWIPIGQKSDSNEWLFMYPEGLRKYQTWITKRYRQEGQPQLAIIVTENGWGEKDEDFASNTVDIDRCNYYRDYIKHMSLGVHEDGNLVKGYFAWSLMDNFEWAEGYTTRFGLTYVNYKTQERSPKLSFHWMQKHVFPLKQLP